jgi:uncharacterized membrane protein
MDAKISRAWHLNARLRLTISTGVAVVVWFATHGRVHLATENLATWDAFALSLLALAWLAILTTPQPEIRRQVKKQDVAGPWIFGFVVVAACAGLFAVVFLFHGDKNGPTTLRIVHILLTLFAVISSWALVHTVFGLHYAHTFYGDGEDPNRHAGGLDFPSEPLPDYTDFAYFSFVIGMTFQVSDVQVTSRALRKMVLVHGILSFAFNTIILALTINTVSSLL